MAGMFYSLEEASAKLNLNPEQVTELVEQGKLREFRDGNKVLFKVNEVEALMADTGLASSISEAVVTDEAELGPEDLGLVISDDTKAEEPAADAGVDEKLSREDGLDLLAEDTKTEGSHEAPQPEPVAEEDLSLESDLGLLAKDTKSQETPEPLATEPAQAEEDLSLESDIDIFSEDLTDQPAETGDKSEETELSLSMDEDEHGSTKGLQITSDDTATTSEGIDVLDGTESEFSLTDDTMAETKAMEEASSLEDIEGDVNLDSFGSGSGLLDLSLQADDTSLGGILDEIYTPESEGGEIPAEASAADVAAEAESMMAGEQMAMPAAMAQGYIEPEPDLSSNVFGFALLVPLLVIIYAVVTTISGQAGVLPGIVPKGMMAIYILVALLVVGLGISAYGYMAAAPAGPKTAKPKKKKTPKAPKSKKVKKEKPKKEKKKKK